MTSYIVPHLPPVDALPGRNLLFCLPDPHCNGRMFKKMGVIGQRVQTIRRELVNFFLDLVTQLSDRHW